MIRFAVSLFLLAAFLVLGADAQGPPPGMPGGMGSRPPRDMGPGSRYPPGPGDSHLSFSGKWWTNPGVVRRLGLSDDQQKQIDRIFQQSRLRLIDLQATLEKQESLLDPLLAEDHPQEALVAPQIDRVAGARAELEKANARMLFSFRLVLTTEQWKELQSADARPRNMPPFHRPR